MITRDEMINKLTFAMFDSMENDAEYRLEICRYGHKGFEDYTDEELKREYMDYIDEESEES